MANLKAYWQEQMLNYAVLDQGAGTVRIPISEAKRLMLERNMFPVRNNTNQSGAASGQPQPSIPAEEQPPTFQSSGRQGDRRLQ